MGYERHPQFTFGPRHRLVVKHDRLGWWRVAATLATFAVLIGLVFAAIFGAPPAFAQDVTHQLQSRAEELNSKCRDAEASQKACVLRDKLLRILANRGQCWNPHAATPAQLWQPCAPADERRQNLIQVRNQYSEICERTGEMAYVARDMALNGQTPKATYAVLANIEHRGAATAVGAERMTWKAFTQWQGFTPETARRIEEGVCRRGVGLL